MERQLAIHSAAKRESLCPHKIFFLEKTRVGRAVIQILVDMPHPPRQKLRLVVAVPFLALIVLIDLPTTMALATMNTKATSTAQGKWSDIAIQTAQGLTITERERLYEEGVMDIDWPVQIKAQSVDSTLTQATNTKIIHFQRHGQGFHNVICETWRELTGNPVNLVSTDPKENPMLREYVLDSPLTEVGRQQCLACRDEASRLQPEIVVVSPLVRAIQSAELSWSTHRSTVPWVAHEGCREELGLLVCNKRRSISEIQTVYPDIDFSLCAQDDTDTLFMEDQREPPRANTQRVYDFLLYLRDLPQTEIAVVGHSAWLFNMCNAVMEIDEEHLKSWFLTSEIRSLQVTFVDKEEEKV